MASKTGNVAPASSRYPLNRPLALMSTSPGWAASGGAAAWGFASTDITPPYFVDAFEATHHHVEQKTDESNEYHTGDHEVVPVSGVARIHDHVAESRIDGHHFRGDDHQPGDAKTDAHAGDDLRHRRRNHDLTQQF